MRVLVFAGLDPSGRAGLLADGEAIRALGAIPVLCATGVAAQSGARLVGLYPVSPEALQAQVEAALEDGPLGAIKIGMLGSEAGLARLVTLLRGPLCSIPLVFDPVLATSRGGALFAGAPSALWPLIERAELCTPNLEEAERLTGSSIRAEKAMEPVARELLRRGAKAVLLKGGHLEGAPADLLATSDTMTWFRGVRLPSRRGTGCRLASGIAARRALGDPLPLAIEAARAFVAAYLAG